MKYCSNCKTVYPADFQCCPKDGSALSSSSELLPGMVIRDKYQILQQIGSGGMATVYQVRHLAFNEIKAIKLINSQLADGDQFNKRLRAEAVIARKLQHPNAVHVEDLDRTEDGRPFIVMEYVEGENLRNIIRREGPLPTLRALCIAMQVVSALAAAHKLGIIHRDIKPDNIHLIRQPDGTDFVKVLDFGIAKFTQGLSSSALTGSGLVVGTPQYVSPEQAMGKQGGDLDGRSDLYTLGIVLYEMLTGRVPFESDTPVGLLVHHLHTTPVPPDELRPDLGIPASVSGLLMKALQKSPEQRFRNADEMLNAITTLEAQVQQRQEAGTVETEVPFVNRPKENPELRFLNADDMLSAITPVEHPVPTVQETGIVSMKTAEESAEQSSGKTEGILAGVPPVPEQVKEVAEIGAVLIASVEEPVSRVEETGSELMKMPEVSAEPSSPSTDSTPILIAPVEEQVTRVEQPGTVLMKALEVSSEPRSHSADAVLNLIPSKEEQATQVEQPGTILMKAPELRRDPTKPPAADRIPSGIDVARVESSGFRDASKERAAPLDPSRHRMWPAEAPRLRDTREKNLPTAYNFWNSRRNVYIGLALIAVVSLAILGIYQWLGASAKPSGQSAQDLHDGRLAGAGAPIQPAAQVTGGLHSSATEHTSGATQPISTSEAGVTRSTSPILGEPEKLARIKDLVSQGRALSDNGEYTAAIEMFDSALKLDPQSSEAKTGKRRAKERMQLEQALPPTESK
jgi:serine/threonine protein kinase